MMSRTATNRRAHGKRSAAGQNGASDQPAPRNRVWARPPNRIQLLDFLCENGFKPIFPSILQPAALFVDIIGEDLRHRMFLTRDGEASQLCLRPDFTVPVCAAFLSGTKSRARWCYEGPVFRQPRGAPGAPGNAPAPSSLQNGSQAQHGAAAKGASEIKNTLDIKNAGEAGDYTSAEIWQAGVEDFGHDDPLMRDAELLQLAERSLMQLGLGDLRVQTGDVALFEAVIASLEIPPFWLRRLRRAIATGAQLRDSLQALRDQSEALAHSQVNQADEDDSDGQACITPATARLLAQARLKMSSHAHPRGGRRMQEIARRYAERIEIAQKGAIPASVIDCLSEFFDLEGPLGQGIKPLEKFWKAHRIANRKPLTDFVARARTLEKIGIDCDRLQFSGAFGRQVDYYSGFNFEMMPAGGAGAPLAAGGRYDRLLDMMRGAAGKDSTGRNPGKGAGLTASGFCIWLERAARARPAARS